MKYLPKEVFDIVAKAITACVLVIIIQVIRDYLCFAADVAHSSDRKMKPSQSIVD
jgi:hypothetical protein